MAQDNQENNVNAGNTGYVGKDYTNARITIVEKETNKRIKISWDELLKSVKEKNIIISNNQIVKK